MRSISLDQTELAYPLAHIERGSTVVITTAASLWSYAAALPLAVDAAGGADLAIEARLQVLEGKVRVGVLSPDQQSFVVEEEAVARDGLRAFLVLRLPSPPLVGPLIVRNASEAGPSKAILEEVTIYRIPRACDDANELERRGVNKPSRDDVRGLVKSLEYLRPLLPYPGWHFDSDWQNSDFSFQTRRRLWDYCRSHGCDIAVDLPWYGAQRVQLPLLSDAGRQLFVGGCIDPNEFTFLDCILKPGMVFVDVGAHIGFYTIFAARRVAKVVAFEPSSREFAWLRRNVESNELSNVAVVHSALGNTEKQAKLHIAESMHSGQNTLHLFLHEGVASESTETVEVTCLDRLVEQRKLDRVDVIKADVEQSELEVFEGSEHVLRTMRPWLLLEACYPKIGSPRTSAHDLIGLLQSFGYTFYGFDHATGLLVEATGNHESGNLVGCPSRRELPEDVLSARRFYFAAGGERA